MTAEPQQNCPFCTLVEQGKQELLYKDDELYVTVDIRPHAPHHYLVIPHRHHRAANTLSSWEDAQMVRRMVDVGVRVLKERNGGSADDVRMGFHWPPLTSLEHLHMHVMCPQSEMGFLARNLIFKPGLLFVTPGYLCQRIESRLEKAVNESSGSGSVAKQQPIVDGSSEAQLQQHLASGTGDASSSTAGHS